MRVLCRSHYSFTTSAFGFIFDRRLRARHRDAKHVEHAACAWCVARLSCCVSRECVRGHCADVRVVIAGVYFCFAGVAAAQHAAVAELYGHTVLIGRMLLVLDADSDDDVGIGTLPQRLWRTQLALGTPLRDALRALCQRRSFGVSRYTRTAVRTWPLCRYGCHYGCLCFTGVAAASRLRPSALSAAVDFGLSTVTQIMSSMQLVSGAWPV